MQSNLSVKLAWFFGLVLLASIGGIYTAFYSGKLAIVSTNEISSFGSTMQERGFSICKTVTYYTPGITDKVGIPPNSLWWGDSYFHGYLKCRNVDNKTYFGLLFGKANAG